MGRVLITGASSGIGRALALELARRGHDIAAGARRTDRLQELAGEIESLGRRALPLEMDVQDPTTVEAAVTAVTDAWGGVDIAIANAGISIRSTMRRLELDDARAMSRTNFEGVLNLYVATVPAMIERGSGHFVAISSISSFRGIPGLAVYSATKAAVRALMEAARVELASTGVRVTTVNPGFVETEMTNDSPMPMPFLVRAEPAARTIADAIESGKKELNFPLPMTLFMRLVRMLPIGLYDRLTAPFTRKRKRA